MAVELGTVKSRLSRARAQLRVMLSEKGELPAASAASTRERPVMQPASHVDDDDLSALDRPAAQPGRVCASAGPRRGVRGVSGAPGRVAIGSDAAATPARGRAAARFLAGPTPRGGPAKRRAFATLVHGHARGGGRAGGDVRGAGRGHAVRRLASRVERRARNRTSPGGASAGGQQPGRRADRRCSCRGARGSSRRGSSTGPCRRLGVGAATGRQPSGG